MQIMEGDGNPVAIVPMGWANVMAGASRIVMAMFSSDRDDGRIAVASRPSITFVLRRNAMGCSIYAHDLQNNIYTLDCATGSINKLANLSAALAAVGAGTLLDIACHGSTLWGIGGNILVRINAGDWTVTAIGPLGSSMNALAVSSAGIIYGAGGGGFWRINPVTGAGTYIGDYSGYGSSGDIAFDCNDVLYGTVFAGQGDELAIIDVGTGQASSIGPIGINSVFGLTFYGCRLYGASGDGRVLTINADSGVGTQIGRPGPSFGGLATCCCNCGCGC